MLAYVLLRVFAVILLVAANAFFVAAEFALVSVRDTRVHQMVEARRIGARTVEKLRRSLDEVLNGVQVGITATSLALGWSGESAMAVLFQPLFAHVPYAAVYAHTLAVVVAFTLITYLHMILGEIVPKSLALQSPERVALAVATPMDVYMTLAAPFLKVMTASGRTVLRLMGTPEVHVGTVHSAEELRMMVSNARRFGVVPQFEEEVILHTLEMEDVTVRQIMVPRHSVFSLPSDMPLDQALVRVVEEQHSRVPVYDAQRGPEHIVGLLYSKDLTRWMRAHYTAPAVSPMGQRLARLRIADIMRDVLVVPETKPLPDLLAEFKRRKRHLAVVVDEFGSISGVVTVEDVLEQLVGEIEDEFDLPPSLVQDGGPMHLDGSTNIRDLQTRYSLTLPDDQGFETLAGFVLWKLQRLPRTGDTFEFENRRFTVTDMEGNRIVQVQVEQLQTETVPEK
ncbi:MAG: hemolysin family protein [Candidatus Korobacteraceae bacterium]